MAFQCLATFNKTHKWDQGPKCFSVLSETTAKSRCLQTSKNRVSIYNILPPQITLCLVFSLKISWAGQLRTSGGFFSSICLSNLPLNPQTEQFQNAVTKFHVPENMPQHQKYSERCFCLESHSTRFSVHQCQQPGKQQPHLLLVLSDMSLAAVTLMARRAGGPEMCKWPKRTSCLQRGKKNSRTT